MRSRIAVLLLALAVGATACETDPAPEDGPPPPEAEDPAAPEPEPQDPGPDEPDEHADSGQPGPEEPAADPGAATVELEEIATLAAPTAAAAREGDDALFVAERDGRVLVLRDGEVDADPVLDLSDETTTDAERGLLGIAFSADGDRLFASYTDLEGANVVAEYTVDGDVVDVDSRRALLRVEQPYGNHNGGNLAVGPDGMLYVGLGDGGGAGDPLEAGQDPTTLLGSMLRLDPDADDAVPDDNPFVDDAGGADEVWAYGLRNPWRFSFDRETGDLWIADVGQDSVEEINFVAAGEGAGVNFGWNLMEGNRPFAGEEPDDHRPPVHEYETTAQRCAITGGYVYRGEELPQLAGAYVFSDFCEGRVRALQVTGDGEVVEEHDLEVEAGAVVSFAEDGDGELVVLSLDGGVFRLVPA